MIFGCSGLLVLLCCVIMYSSRLRFKLSERYPVYLGSLSGNYLTSIEDIRAIIEQDLRLGFLGISTSKVRTDLQKLPWINEVKVSRKLPNKLIIELFEHKLLAYFGSDGVVTQDMKILKRSSINNLKQLPWFIGKEDDVGRLVMAYNQLLPKLQGDNLSIALLEVMADRGLRAIINNKLYNFAIYFGKQDFMDRLHRLRLLTNNIMSNSTGFRRINYIDLRYTNGVAISWQGSQLNG